MTDRATEWLDAVPARDARLAKTRWHEVPDEVEWKVIWETRIELYEI